MDHMSSKILLVRNVWALRILRLVGRWADGGGGGGRARGRANFDTFYILIHGKWLLVKLSLCAKYVIIISGQVQRGV